MTMIRDDDEPMAYGSGKEGDYAMTNSFQWEGGKDDKNPAKTVSLRWII